jgi:hypothetical protein
VWRLALSGAVADAVIGVDGDDLVLVRSDPPSRGPHFFSLTVDGEVEAVFQRFSFPLR